MLTNHHHAIQTSIETNWKEEFQKELKNSGWSWMKAGLHRLFHLEICLLSAQNQSFSFMTTSPCGLKSKVKMLRERGTLKTLTCTQPSIFSFNILINMLHYTFASLNLPNKVCHNRQIYIKCAQPSCRALKHLIWEGQVSDKTRRSHPKCRLVPQTLENHWSNPKVVLECRRKQHGGSDKS